MAASFDETEVPALPSEGIFNGRTVEEAYHVGNIFRRTGKNLSTVIQVLKMHSCPPPPKVCKVEIHQFCKGGPSVCSNRFDAFKAQHDDAILDTPSARERNPQ